MRVGVGSDLMGMATRKYQVIGETMMEDEKAREGIANLIKKNFLFITPEELANQILALFHSEGQYILKRMPEEITRLDGSKYWAEPMSGIFLRDKSEITIKEGAK
mgnify:FL=1